MDCENILHNIGDVASIMTVIGGLYGLIKWIQSRQAKVILTEYKHSDQCLYIAYVYNKGLATAYNIKITSASKYKIETSAYIPCLQPSEQGQLGFAFRQKISSIPIYIRWTDGMGRHKKRIVIEV